jgi:putative hemolysin
MGKSRWGVTAAAVALCAGVLASCGSDNGGGSAGAATTTPSGDGFDVAAARTYCTDKGGKVEVRHPVWGTNNNASTWVTLPGEAEMCTFQTLNDTDKSKIVVDLHSLYSTEPTLASVAYLAKIAPPPFTGANPATLDCTALGASSQFGNTLDGGGWLPAGSTDGNEVVNLCVFPDLSFIDDWGITYYAGGVVRGIDLKTVLKYQPSTLPPIFHAAKS